MNININMTDQFDGSEALPGTRSRSSSINSKTSAFSKASFSQQSGRRYNSIVSANDVVLGIERVSEKDRSFGGSDRADSQHNSLLLTKSQSEKKQHTAMSRWSRLKTMVGVKASQPFAAPVNINAKDYESIFEEWSAQSEEEGHPFIKRERIIHEFDKRKKQSTTKDAKAKLDLRGCDLSDNHVKTLVRAIAHTPKISALDLRDNPKLTEESKRILDHLILCQADASRRIGPDGMAAGICFVQDVKWGNVVTDSHSESSSQAAGSSDGFSRDSGSQASSFHEDLDQSRDKIKIELQHSNAKSQLRILYMKETNNETSTLERVQMKKIWKKVVTSKFDKKLDQYISLQNSNAGVHATNQDCWNSYATFEKFLIWGLVDIGKLKPFVEQVQLDTSFELEHELDSQIDHQDTIIDDHHLEPADSSEDINSFNSHGSGRLTAARLAANHEALSPSKSSPSISPSDTTLTSASAHFHGVLRGYSHGYDNVDHPLDCINEAEEEDENPKEIGNERLINIDSDDDYDNNYRRSDILGDINVDKDVTEWSALRNQIVSDKDSDDDSVHSEDQICQLKNNNNGSDIADDSSSILNKEEPQGLTQLSKVLSMTASNSSQLEADAETITSEVSIKDDDSESSKRRIIERLRSRSKMQVKEREYNGSSLMGHVEVECADNALFLDSDNYVVGSSVDTVNGDEIIERTGPHAVEHSLNNSTQLSRDNSSKQTPLLISSRKPSTHSQQLQDGNEVVAVLVGDDELALPKQSSSPTRSKASSNSMSPLPPTSSSGKNRISNSYGAVTNASSIVSSGVSSCTSKSNSRSVSPPSSSTLKRSSSFKQSPQLSRNSSMSKSQFQGEIDYLHPAQSPLSRKTSGSGSAFSSPSQHNNQLTSSSTFPLKKKMSIEDLVQAVPPIASLPLLHESIESEEDYDAEIAENTLGLLNELEEAGDLEYVEPRGSSTELIEVTDAPCAIDLAIDTGMIGSSSLSSTASSPTRSIDKKKVHAVTTREKEIKDQLLVDTSKRIKEDIALSSDIDASLDHDQIYPEKTDSHIHNYESRSMNTLDSEDEIFNALASNILQKMRSQSNASLDSISVASLRKSRSQSPASTSPASIGNFSGQSAAQRLLLNSSSPLPSPRRIQQLVDGESTSQATSAESKPDEFPTEPAAALAATKRGGHVNSDRIDIVANAPEQPSSLPKSPSPKKNRFSLSPSTAHNTKVPSSSSSPLPAHRSRGNQIPKPATSPKRIFSPPSPSKTRVFTNNVSSAPEINFSSPIKQRRSSSLSPKRGVSSPNVTINNIDGGDSGNKKDYNDFEFKSLHPAFRRHDGRHKTIVATTSQQLNELQRIRSMGEPAACTLITSYAGNHGMTANPLLVNSSSGISPMGPTVSSVDRRVVIESSNPSPTKRRQQVNTRLISSNTVALPINVCVPSSSGSHSDGPEKLHSTNPINISNSTVLSYAGANGFPRRLDLSKGNRTTQNIKFQTYLKPEQFSQVQSLLLHHNTLTLIERLFLKSRFPNLVELDLSNNCIATSMTINCFPKSLIKLDLSHNEIKNVKELGNLSNLMELNLAHNKLKQLDPLPKTLVKLDISHNWIDFPEKFSILHENINLQWLNIMHNSIPEGYLNVVAKDLLRSLPLLQCSPVDFDALYADYDAKAIYKPVFRPKEMKQVISRLSVPSPERYRRSELEIQLEQRKEKIEKYKEKSAAYYYQQNFHNDEAPIHERFTSSFLKHIQPKEEVIIVGDRTKPYCSPTRGRPGSRSTTPTYTANNRSGSNPSGNKGPNSFMAGTTTPMPLSKSLMAPTASSKTRDALKKQAKEEEELRKKRDLELRPTTPIGGASTNGGISRSSSRSSIASRGGASVSSRSISTVRSSTVIRKVIGGGGAPNATIQSILQDESSISASAAGLNHLMTSAAVASHGGDDHSSVGGNISVNSSITGTVGNSTIVTKDTKDSIETSSVYKEKELQVGASSSIKSTNSIRATPPMAMFANQKVVSLEDLLGKMDA